jgi:hypothetical protein
MKKKKVLLRNELSEVVFNNDRVVISNFADEWIFEIGNDITNDIAEAVSILIRRVDYNDPVWKMEVKNIIVENIIPEKSLFWLTGGYKEWEKLDNYSKPWHDCYLDFQEEFGFIVVRSIKRAKTLKDIRDNFLRYLNLPVLYDFAVSKNLVR